MNIKVSPFNCGAQHIEFASVDGEWHLFGRDWFRDNSEHVTLGWSNYGQCAVKLYDDSSACEYFTGWEGSQS